MTQKRGPGRPRVSPIGDPSVKVSLSIPGRTYDELCALAFKYRVSVQEIIRLKLRAYARRYEEAEHAGARREK